MSVKDIQIRLAISEEDHAAIYRLRYELYVEDQGLFRNEADHERRFLMDELDARSQLILAEVEGDIAGTARLTSGLDGPLPDDIRETYDIARFRGILEEEDIAVGTRLLLRHEHRGGDMAYRCIARMLELAVEQDIDLILGNCETHLVNNYMKLGFRPYGGLYNHPENGMLVRVALVTGDHEHLAKLKSPLLPIARRQPTPAPREKVERICSALASDAAARSKFDTTTIDYVGEVSESLRDGERLCGIMDTLSLEEARALLDMSHILRCSEGDAIIRKGHVSRTLYMLLSGSLDVRDEEGLVAHLEERGTLVGEVAFFSAGGRMSDVVAAEDGTRVLALSDRVLRQLISDRGPVAAKFLHFVACGLAEKLRGQAVLSKHPGLGYGFERSLPVSMMMSSVSSGSPAPTCRPTLNG